MYCTNCGKELPEGSSFCTECGARVEGAGAQDTARTEATAPLSPPVEKTAVATPVASARPVGQQVPREVRPNRLAAHVVACVLGIIVCVLPLFGLMSVMGQQIGGVDLASLWVQARPATSLLKSAGVSADGIVVPLAVLSAVYCLLWLATAVADIACVASTCVSRDGSGAAVAASVLGVAFSLYPLVCVIAANLVFGDVLSSLGSGVLSTLVLFAPTGVCWAHLVVALAQLVMVLAPECYPSK